MLSNTYLECFIFTQLISERCASHNCQLEPDCPTDTKRPHSLPLYILCYIPQDSVYALSAVGSVGHEGNCRRSGFRIRCLMLCLRQVYVTCTSPLSACVMICTLIFSDRWSGGFVQSVTGPV
eukprot:6200752-Pyramimonas_sp.AAC.1